MLAPVEEEEGLLDDAGLEADEDAAYGAIL